MQKLLSLNNIGTKGLNTDVTQWDLPPEFITSGVNFRIFANAIRTSGGYADWSVSPVMFNPGHIMHVGATSGDYWLVAGRTAVYSFDGQNWSDVSSAAGYAGLGPDDELNWTGCMLGKIPIINSPQHSPEYWSPPSPGQLLQPLNFSPTATWDETDKSFQVIRSHKNFLFALNLQEGLNEIPDGYRWSHPADINGLPFTWDETDQSALAGIAQLGGDGGAIIDGQSLRDSFAMYSENSIDILDFTGDEFVWRRRELSNTVGLLSKQCLIEVKGTHFFLADGDIVKNDGNSIESIVHNRIRRQLTARMNTDYYHRSYAVRNNSLKEMWFCVPEEGAEYPNVAYIYNWKDDTWAIRTLPYETSPAVDPLDPPIIDKAVAFSGYGPQSAPTLAWDDWQGTWDSQERVWGSRQRTPLDDTIVGVDGAGSSLLVLDPTDIRNSGPLGTRIERTNFPLEGMRQVTTITRVYPHMQGTEPVQIQFGSQDYAGAPIRWKPAQTFTPGMDRKLDIRTTGELHSWRIQSLGEGNWVMSGMDIEYTPNGVR